jgi:hypothetical protein
MAKAQSNQGTEYVALPKGAIDALGDEPISDEELAFDEFVGSMSAERMGELRVGKIKVAKDGTPIANTRGAHCFACPIDQFTYSGLLEHIRDKYGAGLYRLVGTEAGKRGLVFNRLIEIAESIAPKSPAQESPLQNPQNMLESVGRIMAESAARTEALIARLTETKAPTVDPMDSMTKMATMFSTMMASMAGMFKQPAAGGGGDILDQAEKLLKLKELLGGGSSGNDSGAESNFFDVVKAGLQSFGPALATLAVRGAQNQEHPALAAPGAPQVIPAAQPNTASYQKPGPTMRQPDPAMANFKRQVDTLVQNAKSGVDPMQLAGTILDLTPDEKLDDLEAMLQAPDMIEKMAALNPEVQIHRQFFDKLRSALLTLLMEETGDTLAPDQPEQPAAGGSGAPTS